MTDPQTVGQWIAVGGVTVLLVWLLRFAATYQSVMTKGAYERIRDLEATVDRLDDDLLAERKRCDELAARVWQLEQGRPR